MNDKGFIVITVLFMLLLLSVTALTLSSRAGVQSRMASNQTDAVQGYFSQQAVIEQSAWKLAQDPCWRVPAGENYTYNGKTYTRKVMTPDTVTYPALLHYKDAIIVSVTAPYASRAVNQSLRYTMDTASPVAIGTTKSVHVTSAGHIYFTDIDTHSVWRIDRGTGAQSRVAGTGTSGYSGDGGPATSAQLNRPMGVITDTAGNVYVAEYNGSRIRKVDILGTITTIAGTGSEGYSGDGGPAVNARLFMPQGMAWDPQGNLLIADSHNCVIRKVDKFTQIITTIAGTGSQGYSGDGGPALSAKFKWNADIAVDGAGNIFVADSGNNVIRKISAATQIITTIAGTGSAAYSGDGGPATAAALNDPSGIDVDASGNIYIADEDNCRIRKISASDNKIRTIAGNGTCAYAGDGGSATSANINHPKGVAVKSTGEVIISDAFNQCIRQVATGNTISTFPGTTPGQGLNTPEGVAPYFDTAQNKLFLFIAETANNRIRKLDTVNKTVVTVAGTGTAGSAGDFGLAADALLRSPEGVWVDSSGDIYIADTGNHKIRKVHHATNRIYTVAGTGASGSFGDGGWAPLARLDTPRGVFVGDSGDIYIADTGNHKIRKVHHATDIISTVAGTGASGSTGDGGPATSARLNAPSGVFLDSGVGDIYIADTGNHKIRKVHHATDIISTVAGTGTSGSTGDGGPATSATLNAPEDVAMDGAGNLYIADTGNNALRIVNSHDGKISTMAGTGAGGYNGDLQPAVTAQLNAPSGVAAPEVKDGGSIYVSDTVNNRVRRMYLETVKELY
jgi:trimeric autotransporter adhesin